MNAHHMFDTIQIVSVDPIEIWIYINIYKSLIVFYTDFIIKLVQIMLIYRPNLGRIRISV